MKIKANSLKSTFILIELLLPVIVCIGNFMQNSFLISIAFLCTFAVLMLFLVQQSHGGKFNVILSILVMLSVINVVFNAMISPVAQISFDYMKKLIMFICSITFFVLMRDAQIIEKDKEIAYRAGLAITFLFPFAYFVLNIRTKLGFYLTMGFTNPNFTALWAFHGFLFAMIALFRNSRLWLKVVCAAGAIACLYIASQTLNRAIWVAFACFIGLLLYGIVGRKRSLNPIALTLIIVLPIIVVIIYHALLESSAFQRAFSFLVSKGKVLDSRTRVWDFAVEKLKHGWLLGDYSGISNGTGLSQMHNTHLDVLCSYGIIPFCLFIYVLRSIAVTINASSKTLEQYVSLCAFLSVILFGVFEAALFSGCTGLNYLTGAFLILAKPIYEENSICSSNAWSDSGIETDKQMDVDRRISPQEDS